MDKNEKFNRFGSVCAEEKQKILDGKESENSLKSSRLSYCLFDKYCTEKNLVFDINSVSKGDLDAILQNFYLDARKEDGHLYKKSSLVTLRFGLQREIHRIRKDFNIIEDPEFRQSSDIFNAQCVRLKKMGLGKVEHKPKITQSDMSILYSSGVFSTASPKSLQRKVFFEVMLHLCRRGRENLRNLEKDSFIVRQYPDGIRYILLAKDELTKNHRVNDECHDGGLIVETKGINCPVKSFIMYLSKLNPNNKFFFQRPKPKEKATAGGPWYDNQVLGVKSLETMMRNISKDANLSTVYTNHCIRATCITLLDGAGVEARHIMSVSGHKSECSIRSYAKTSNGIKRKISSTLSAAISDKPNFDFGIDFLYNENEDDGTDFNIEQCKIPKQAEIKSPAEFLSRLPPTVNTSEETPSCSRTLPSNSFDKMPMSYLIKQSNAPVKFSNCYFNF